MKSKVLLVALAVFAMLAVPASASITVAVGQEYTVTGPTSGDLAGGPFKMRQVDGNVEFWTFCVQRNETIGLGGDYEISGIQTNTVEKKPDAYLTGYAAWVYTKFFNEVDHALTKPADLSFNEDQRELLQKAMWAGMIKEGSDDDGDHIIVANDLLVGRFDLIGTGASLYSLDDAEKDALNVLGFGLDTFRASSWQQDSLGYVRVLNLVDSSGKNVQDVVGMVPEPASLAIWALIATGGAAAAARRRRRRWSDQNRQKIRDIVTRN